MDSVGIDTPDTPSEETNLQDELISFAEKHEIKHSGLTSKKQVKVYSKRSNRTTKENNWKRRTNTYPTQWLASSRSLWRT